MEILGALLAIVLAIPFIILYSSFSWAYVLLIFWSWFILPVFPQLPEITFYQALGLYLFTTFFKNHYYTPFNKKFEKENVDNNIKYTVMFLGPWLTLLIGYFIHLFI